MKDERHELSRRQFISTAAATASAASLLLPSVARAQSGGTLRVGLVGCGGRGTGAAAQALQADPQTKLVAVGDAFEDRLQTSLKALKAQDNLSEKIDVTPDQCFVGFDAFEKVIRSV